MLENIRKYTGLFIVVLVLIFVGLIFLGDNMSASGPGSGPTLVKTKYENFSQKELQKRGAGYLQLAQRVMQTSIQNGSFNGYQDISQYLGVLGAQDTAEGLKTFLVNRANFDRAVAKFGLYPSQEEIDVYQRETLFTGRDGLVNKEAYDTFIDKGLKGVGTLNDLNRFAGDILAFKKLTEVLGAAVQGNETAAQENFLSSAQTMNVSTLALSLADFQKDIQPTDEELKTYWEENRGRYLSEAKRKLTYFVAKPDYEKALAEKIKKQAEKTDEEKAADDAEKTPAELAADAEAPSLTDEERSKEVDKLGLVIEEDIWVVIQQQVEDGAKKADLETLAKEYGFEVKTTELLPVAELPAEIRGPIRGTQGRTVENEVLDARINPSNVMDSVSEILGVGTDGWLLFRIDEAVEPTELAFEEAMDKAKADLVKEKSLEALTAAIESAREEVAKALEEGKPLNEVAAAQNLKLAQHLNLTAGAQLPGEPSVRDVFRLASQTKSGSVSKAEVMQPGGDRALFVYVEEREFVESDENKDGLDRALSTQQQQMKNMLVEHYFTAAYDEADVEFVRPE